MSSPDACALDWERARDLAYRVPQPTPPVEISLDDAVGRTLARDATARIPIPHYVSSAMDGWAVAGDGPWRLAARRRLGPGEATPILTGSVVPEGADAVLRSEQGRVHDSVLSVAGSAPPRTGEHIRAAGTEAAAGEVLVAAGRLLNPAHIALLASGGQDELWIRAAPRVRFVLSGNEVVRAGLPGPGLVRDSFGPQLPALFAALGARVTERIYVSDDAAATRDALCSGPDVEAVITTGGSANSPADQVRLAVAALGGEFLVPGVRMRPGGPAFLARLPRGTLVLGLPGNPLAAFAAALSIGIPLMAGLHARPLPSLASVQLASPQPGAPAATTLTPFAFEGGEPRASRWNRSAMVRGLAEADGMLVIPPGGAAAGTTVAVLELPWAT